jgi:NNP family nitrate/nitrite transporter-like MFS transporter
MSEGTIANRSGAVMALTMSTLAFSFCFACWVINAVLVTFLVSTGEYAFSDSQVGWLLAVPILTGAVSRLPLGMLTDRMGGRKVFSVLMLVIAIPMFLLSQADSYAGFLLASMGFGLAGGSFAVGIGYVSSWFDKERQGTAMGIFGAGNAGAAATTILAPQVLKILTDDGANLAAWRQLPQLYAGLLVVVALIFFLTTRERRVERRRLSMAEQLAPLKSIIVWRFGFYYFLVFGGFVSLAQWIIPYSVNVYEMTVIQAGLLAALFSLPSGVIRAAGGWLSDHFGPRTVMYWVFWACLLSCLVAAVPRMDVRSPGEGVTSRQTGEVAEVSAGHISIEGQSYALTSPPQKLPAETDDGTMFLPRIVRWHEPVVEPGDPVIKKQLLARGISNLYYPSNVWIFAAMLLVVGVATGIGKAGVYRFIPDSATLVWLSAAGNRIVDDLLDGARGSFSGLPGLDAPGGPANHG